VSSAAVGALVGAAACVLASPYLARLTRTVVDDELRDWWRGAAVARQRVGVCAVIAAAFGGLAGAAAGWSALLPALVALALVGVPLVVIDYEHHRLPNRLVVVAAVAGAVLLTVAALRYGSWAALLRSAEGAGAVFAVLFVLCFVAPRSFGFGDVKLGGVLGGYLGWFGWGYVYYGIFIGFVLGALLAVAMLLARRATMKTHLAFGPMLITGALIVLAFDLVPSSLA
jgi:leader peptidase (prepilin peptidase)/N-methyltransferase